MLFTPAGMNQFKREFMGLGDPNLKAATTCQKCVRTGDIDNVGRTPRHMTFFEMLGNFSFGDYFKKEAIHWGWEFLTKTLRVPGERLTVTVYLDDDEAFNIWHKQIGLDPSRITRMGEDDNFWPAGAPTHGPDGVCGPCSEIFYHGDGIEEVEIWNLVFTQFNRVGPGQLEPLPKQNIDTGMGLERMAAALQGVPTNFDIDILKPLVLATAEQLGKHYESASTEGVRIRRIADHVRALTFMIHENVKPSGREAGLYRPAVAPRALLDAYLMGQKDPFLAGIVPTVAEVMKRPIPSLRKASGASRESFARKRNSSSATSIAALNCSTECSEKQWRAGSDMVSGKDSFTLLATYGIPIEVTESLAAEQNLRVDRPGFQAAMDEHSAVSRGTTEAAAVFTAGPLDTLKKSFHHGSDFLGYTTIKSEGRIIGIGRAESTGRRATAGPSDAPLVAVVLDRTPFYGESGGQVGDNGKLVGDGFAFEVTDTKRENDFTLHLGRVSAGEVRVDALILAKVDAERRQAICRAHSATHILHHALHTHLGKHAQQAGSKVEGDRLRVRFLEPRADGARAAPVDRGNGEREDPGGRSDFVVDDADRRGEDARGDGLVW